MWLVKTEIRFPNDLSSRELEFKFKRYTDAIDFVNYWIDGLGIWQYGSWKTPWIWDTTHPLVGVVNPEETYYYLEIEGVPSNR